MKFAIGDKNLDAPLQEDEPGASKHTGRPLRRGHLKFSVQGQERHAGTTSALNDAKKNPGLLVSDADGAEPTHWKVTNSSYSYTDRGSSTVYQYDWTIEEDEEPLQIQQLRIGELALEPYVYEESFDDKDHLTIKARVRLQGEALNRLREQIVAGGYFEVVREGINPQPRQMRFAGGRMAWSLDGELSKQQFRLVDRATDDEPNPFGEGLFEPAMSNMAASLAFVREAFDSLLDLLSAKGTITQEELDSLRQAATERINQRLWRYAESADIDRFPI